MPLVNVSLDKEQSFRLRLLLALVLLAASVLVLLPVSGRAAAAQSDSLPGRPGSGRPGSGRPGVVTGDLTGVLKVMFVDVGQGDATFIQTPEGRTALIDGGDSNTGIVPFLQSQGVTSLDLVIATHPHAEAIGGLVQVMKKIPVSRLVTNGVPNRSPVYTSFLNTIAGARIKTSQARRGDLITLGGLNFIVLNPPAGAASDLNESSLVLQLGYHKTTFLFMGDAGRVTEASLLASGNPLRADILKVGNHGSSSASSPAFLAKVRPAVAVYFAGRKNRNGDPQVETLRSLAGAGALVYGTDKNGTVIVTVSQDGYVIDTLPTNLRATATPRPTRTPAASTPVTALPLEIVSLTTPVHPGDAVRLHAHTLPGASCTLSVTYKTGVAKATGFDSRLADAQGNVYWSWTLSNKMPAGPGVVTVTAVFNGQRVTRQASFQVQE